jgi:hypothetical protein
MAQRHIGKIEAPAGKVVVIQGDSHGDIDLGGRPAPLFVGVPPRLRPLIGREADLAALRGRVCSGEATALTALNVLPPEVLHF